MLGRFRKFTKMLVSAHKKEALFINSKRFKGV